LEIWVVDPSEASLKVAEERFYQIEETSEHIVHFTTDVADIPSAVDVAIIATSSKPRLSALEGLLAHAQVKHLILEKFLFPRLSDYQRASCLLQVHHVDTHVNCTKRLRPRFYQIKEALDLTKPVTITVEGTNWGLCCNSIHQIDIFMMLVNERSYTLNVEGLIPEIFESKRAGYIELYGTMVAETPKGNKLIQTCVSQDIPSTFRIENGDTLILLNESSGLLTINGNEYQTKSTVLSEMIGEVIDNLLDGKDIKLTPYEESRVYHETLLKAVLDFVNDFTYESKDLLPIT
jgi:hypothetical protein